MRTDKNTQISNVTLIGGTIAIARNSRKSQVGVEFENIRVRCRYRHQKQTIIHHSGKMVNMKTE